MKSQIPVWPSNGLQFPHNGYRLISAEYLSQTSGFFSIMSFFYWAVIVVILGQADKQKSMYKMIFKLLAYYKNWQKNIYGRKKHIKTKIKCERLLNIDRVIWNWYWNCELKLPIWTISRRFIIHNQNKLEVPSDFIYFVYYEWM